MLNKGNLINMRWMNDELKVAASNPVNRNIKNLKDLNRNVKKKKSKAFVKWPLKSYFSFLRNAL